MRHTTLTCDETFSRRRNRDAEPDRESRALTCSDAPDVSGMNRAAESSAALSKEALDWARQVYAQEAPDRRAAADLDRRVAASQVAGMDFATSQARQDAARNRTVFQPLEDRLVGDAQGYDTPQRRAEAVARAGADVESAAGMAVDDMNRDLLRRGGSVDDGGARGNTLDLALGKARMRAGASDNAVRNIEQQGYARRMDAAGLGRGVVSSQATQQQIASQTGGAAVGASNAGLAALQSGNSVMQTGFNQGMQGMGQAGNLYGQVAGIQSQTRGQNLQFLSSAMNTGANLYMASDKNKKKGTGKVTQGADELAEINATPVHADWQYDTKKGGPADGGMLHTGPMAQDVRATMGNKTAPGGKVVDLEQMGGKLMAGMQALTKRVERIEKKAGS